MLDFKLSKKDAAELLGYEKLRTEAVNADAMDAMSTRLKNLNVQHQRHEDWLEECEKRRIEIATLIEIENAQTHELVRIANALERAFPKPQSSEGGMTEPIEDRLRKFCGVPPSVQREAAEEIDRMKALLREWLAAWRAGRQETDLYQRTEKLLGSAESREDHG